MFLGRGQELKKLNKRYVDGRFECVVIYGRHRMGKTVLINEFCKGKDVIYFSALNATETENLRALSRSIHTFKNAETAPVAEYQSLEDALAEISILAKQQRVVFVIDEYPYFARSNPAVSSRIQHLIDHVWSESKLFLILCGSSMSFMEYQVWSYESPLYGRRTAQLKIEPMDYRKTAVCSAK
jgi:AAA+ ATPase superfamily predicted ATPase